MGKIMIKEKRVGASSRTPFKHWILNSILGQQVGVLSLNSRKVPCTANPFLIVDMCAGDGTQSKYDEHSSPSIILKHSRFRNIKTDLVFIEKNEHTFNELKKNVSPQPNIRLLNMDANDFIIKPEYDNQAMFINCDPNSINQLPINDRFMNSITSYTSMIITLGCNVGGLKRLTREQREPWFDYLKLIVRKTSVHHDLILCSLVNDSSQWAYLVKIPVVWKDDTIKQLIKKGSAMFKNGVRLSSFATDIDDFRSHVKQLFLTNKENNNA